MNAQHSFMVARTGRRVVNSLQTSARKPCPARVELHSTILRLGRRLETCLSPEDALSAIVETVQDLFRLPYVAVVVQAGSPQGPKGQLIVANGQPGQQIRETILLTYRGETLGQLILALDAAMLPADRRLLEIIAHQAAVALHDLQLLAALQDMPAHLLAACEAERRRLRDDLHDDIGPQLAALIWKIETARNCAGHDSDTGLLLAELASQARATARDVRRVVHNLRPPVLDELGLPGALRAMLANMGYDGSRPGPRIDLPASLPPLPAAVELAAFRIAQEALVNCVRHAGGCASIVRLELDPAAHLLCLEVVDNGRGLGDSPGGVGLRSMRERAEALGGVCAFEPVPGGGTAVRARLPLPREVAWHPFAS